MLPSRKLRKDKKTVAKPCTATQVALQDRMYRRARVVVGQSAHNELWS